jgi:hypothetical protein
VANNFKTDYGFSDRMERHRFNAYGLYQAPWGIEISPLISYHSPQPISVANRVLGNGYIAKRNTLWKDNSSFGSDFRADKNIKLSERLTLQAIVDAFNRNTPETTSLLFNFDGTVQSGWAIRGRRSLVCA